MAAAPRTHTCGGDAAEQAVRRRVRCLLRPPVAADSWALTGCFRVVPQTIHFRQTKGGKFQSALLRKPFHRTEPSSELHARFVEELLGIELLFAGEIYHGKQ